MNRTDAAKVIKEATGGNLINDFAAAPVGYMSLIDNLGLNFTECNRAECARMYTDRKFYAESGGWDGWTEATNAKHINEMLEQLAAQGFEFDSVDFFDEANGTLFINVIKPNATKLADYYGTGGDK